MSEPSLAVIVPLLNEGTILPALLEQLHGLPIDEYLLVDGGSTDGSCDWLQQSGAQWLASLPGRAVQMNAGAFSLKSEIIIFLHADTFIDSSHIEVVRKAMRDEKTVGGRFDVRLDAAAPVYRLIERMINLRSRLTRISTGDQCMFVRRSVFKQLGGFPDQPLMEDIELSKRLKRVGKLACLRETVVTSARRWQRHGVVKTILLMWMMRLRYWLGASPETLARSYRQAR